jgi:hypothetical protein
MNLYLIYLNILMDGINVHRGFCGLKSRLNQLLSYHFQAYYFDFRSISQQDFDMGCGCGY